MAVEGLLGVTIDNSKIVLINMNEIIEKENTLVRNIKDEIDLPTEEDDDIDLDMSVENTSYNDDNDNCTSFEDIPRKRQKFSSNTTNRKKRKKAQIQTSEDVEHESNKTEQDTQERKYNQTPFVRPPKICARNDGKKT